MAALQHGKRAVLRPPPFRDVHVGTDLDGRHDGLGSRSLERRHVLHDAVDTAADGQFLGGLGFEVDVGGPHPDRLLKDLLHGLDRPRGLAIQAVAALPVDGSAIFLQDHDRDVGLAAADVAGRKPLFERFLHAQFRGDQERHFPGEPLGEHLAGRGGLGVAIGDIPQETGGQGHEKEWQHAQAVLVGDEEEDRTGGHEGQRPGEVIAQDLLVIAVHPDAERRPGGGQDDPSHAQPYQAVDRGRREHSCHLFQGPCQRRSARRACRRQHPHNLFPLVFHNFYPAAPKKSTESVPRGRRPAPGNRL